MLIGWGSLVTQVQSSQLCLQDMKPPGVIRCGDRLMGESTCCGSTKTRVRIPGIHAKNPGNDHMPVPVLREMGEIGGLLGLPT